LFYLRLFVLRLRQRLQSLLVILHRHQTIDDVNCQQVTSLILWCHVSGESPPLIALKLAVQIRIELCAQGTSSVVSYLEIHKGQPIVLFMQSLLHSVGECIMCFRALIAPRLSVRLFVRLSRQILLPWYITNGLNNFDKTGKIFTSSYIDDPIIFFKGQGHGSRGEGVHVEAGTSKSVILQVCF